MAKRNHMGRTFHIFRKGEDKLVNSIDKREGTGMRYAEEAEHTNVINSYTVASDGSRCWSF